MKWIKVEEKGTEAAAATAVIVEEASMPVEFIVNRSFLFTIQETSQEHCSLWDVDNPLE